MSDYLFAYGTLQPGFAPTKIARVASNLRPVGEGFLRGVLYESVSVPELRVQVRALADRITESLAGTPG